MYQRETNIGSIIAAFAIGGLIGAGVALLMAPQSGQRTRTMIADKGSEIKDRAIGTVDDTRSRASRAFDGLTNEAKDRVNNLVKRGQEVAEDTQDRLQDKVKEAKKSLSY